MVIFHSFLYVYQRVPLPESMGWPQQKALPSPADQLKPGSLPGWPSAHGTLQTPHLRCDFRAQKLEIWHGKTVISIGKMVIWIGEDWICTKNMLWNHGNWEFHQETWDLSMNRFAMAQALSDVTVSRFSSSWGHLYSSMNSISIVHPIFGDHSSVKQTDTVLLYWLVSRDWKIQSGLWSAPISDIR